MASIVDYAEEQRVELREIIGRFIQVEIVQIRAEMATDDAPHKGSGASPDRCWQADRAS